MAREHKKHHKIPATYLQGFTNDDGVLWVGDDQLKIYPGKPEGLLSESDYYTIRFPSGSGTLVIETKYLQGIEKTYARLFKEKIVQKIVFTDEEKAKMAIFVASMFERQPRKRESLEKFFKDIEDMAKHMRGLSDEAKKRLASMPRSDSSKSIPVSEVLKVGKDVGSFHSSLIPETVSFLAPIIFDMKWAFLVRDGGSLPFITSDNPCTLVNPELEAKYGIGTFGSAPGFAQQGAELSLPLSSEIALLCGWKLDMDRYYIPVGPRLVEDINKRTKRGARTIVSSDKKIISDMVERVKSYHRQKKSSSKK